MAVVPQHQKFRRFAPRFNSAAAKDKTAQRMSGTSDIRTWGEPMKTLIVGTAASAFALAATGLASAADLRMPVKAPAVVVAESWSGLYIGGHAGYAWGDQDPSSVVSTSPLVPANGFGFPAPLDANPKGFVGGAQLGFNWQFANWVLGIEGDISGSPSGSGAAQFTTPALAPSPVGSASLSQDINWLATVRGRLGYTWGPGLIYFTGGGAWADVDYTGSYASAVGVTSATLNASNTLSGWVIGGGYEHKFTQNWSARLEYLYYNLDSTTLSVAADQPVNNVTTTWTVPELQLHVVRAGVNYKF